MPIFDIDPEIKSQRLAERIKKLQEEKAELDKNLETEKQKLNLARKVGILIISEFQGKPFEYKALEALLDKNFIDDFDCEFFKLKPLSADDPRKPKWRGRKKKEATQNSLRLAAAPSVCYNKYPGKQAIAQGP